MSGFDVDAADLFAAQAVVVDAASAGRAELERLRATAHDLFGPGWRGPAATAFAAGWREWVEGAELVIAALVEMGETLGSTASVYEQHEVAVTLELRRTA